MKVTITDEGDRTVGIRPTTVTIDLPWTNLSDEDRDDLRVHLREFWSCYLDMTTLQIYFDDECPDCGHVKEGNDCTNPNCINACTS